MIYFAKLACYKASLTLAHRIYAQVTNWRAFDQQTTGAQIVRAAGSIGANIAEGSARDGKDPARFVRIALGSARETRHWVSVASAFEDRRIVGTWFDLLDVVEEGVEGLLKALREKEVS
jgi:four helix bundle protein